VGFPSAPLRVSRSSNYGLSLTSSPCLDKRDTTEIETWSGSGRNYSPYLRFSPLIGGPTFLPIHVEVILHSSLPPIPSTMSSSRRNIDGGCKEFDADTSTEDGTDGTMEARAGE